MNNVILERRRKDRVRIGDKCMHLPNKEIAVVTCLNPPQWKWITGKYIDEEVAFGINTVCGWPDTWLWFPVKEDIFDSLYLRLK